jgi:hypothetical protein
VTRRHLSIPQPLLGVTTIGGGEFENTPFTRRDNRTALQLLVFTTTEDKPRKAFLPEAPFF